jgi:hypothetical protein
MTNTVALFLGLTLAALAGADALWNGGVGLMFTAGKFLDLVEWVAFWR